MYEQIYQIASRILGVPQKYLDENSSADNLPEWDSLKQLNLVLAIEEEFGVIFSDEEIVEMSSIRKIHEFLAIHTRDKP